MFPVKISHKRSALILAALFLLALLPRLYSAQTVGWSWDFPGSFTLVNFDEGGSCRAALKGFDYSTFVGHQTIAIATALGSPPQKGIEGEHRAVKNYCHSKEHIQVARVYSAVAGSLTVVLIGILGLLLAPSKPQVAWTAAGILALSGFHVSESHSGTVDAPSVFFIYAFLTLMVFAVGRSSRRGIVVSPLLLVFAIWTKYWVFAAAAYLALGSARLWENLTRGLSPTRIIVLLVASVVLFALTTNAGFREAGLYPVLALYYLLVPWRRASRAAIVLFAAMPAIAYSLVQVELIAQYTIGGNTYSVIGWNKLLRNPVNIVSVLVVGLGLPACLFMPVGIKAIFQDETYRRGWVCLAPLVVFFAFMMFISPVTYYRHYLPLIPAAALVAAIGLWSTDWSFRRWFLVLFFVWPSLLMIDMEMDFHRDPRIALRQWYAEHSGEKVFASYYVNPPGRAMSHTRLFSPDYSFGDSPPLRRADYLILSENWYDTAFANELNGPYVANLERLVKTRPEYVNFYRDALAGRHPNLQLERVLDVDNFMPELVLHRWFYGTFQMFVGDIKIFRVVP